MNNLFDWLTDILPHGSGIDCDWHFDMKNETIRASNSYHVMDGYGSYRGYADFTLAIAVADDGQLEFDRLTFHGRDSQYLNRQYMLRDYLEDTLAMSLENLQ